MLNHTGGTYSHSGLIDYPRFPISELHLAKFLDSMEFQGRRVNFKTEVCSKTADPHLTMQWIKEVKMAKSIDELLTSRSIVERTDFHDFDILDAMTASALKRLLDKHIHFRKRVSVEEQRAQNSDRFSRGRQIAYMIYEHSRATGTREAVQGLSDLFTISLQNDDVQDFDQRAKYLQMRSWKDFTSQNCRILFSFRLKLFLYDQKSVRNIGQPSYLQTSVRVRNEIVEQRSSNQESKRKDASFLSFFLISV